MIRSPVAILYDSSGNPIASTQDGSDYRLQSESKVAKGASSLVHLDAVDTVAGRGRLKTTLYSADGEAVSFSSAPPNPESIAYDFAEASGSSNLLVDGGTTPVVFEYLADGTHDISIQEVKLTLASNSITFGNQYFGAKAGPLTNGLLVQVTAGGNTGEVHNLVQNESFVDFASPGGFQWVVSSKDLMSATWLVGGGLKLVGGSADKISLTVRDDLSSAGVYFKCFIKGNLLPD